MVVCTTEKEILYIRIGRFQWETVMRERERGGKSKKKDK